MKINALETAEKTRNAIHANSYEYEIEKYPFKEILEELFGVELEEIHNWVGNFNKFERKNDQLTIIHRVFYSNFKKQFEPIYKDFIRNFLADKINFPFAYQKIPSLRLGLPGNVFVGEYHNDSKYHHPDFELNFNLGLSNCFKPCCLMSERVKNTGKFYPLECPYGNLISFNHVDYLHGSDVNTTNKTLFSIDFRLAMIPFYKEINSQSINTYSYFKLGEYFSSEILNK